MLYNWLCDIYLVELIDSFIDTQKRVSVFYISISTYHKFRSKFPERTRKNINKHYFLGTIVPIKNHET